MRRAAVTGIGLLSPLGEARDDLLSALYAGRSSLAPHLDFPGGCSAHVARSRSWRTPGRTLLLAAEAASRALLEAGVPQHERSRTGLVLGSIVGEVADGMGAERAGVAPRRAAALRKAWNLGTLSKRVARRLGLGGCVIPVTTACSSGLDALGIAGQEVVSGRADVMVAGGVESLAPFQWEGFRRLGALDPEAVRPFDRRRAGTGLAEGACFWILEEEGRALARGAPIFGRIAGWATSTDAHSLVAPEPEGRGLLRAAWRALVEAGRRPEELAFIVAHGTGTPSNDRAEAAALRALFGGTVPGSVPITALKGALGHCLGAAGALEAASALYFLQEGRVPPVTGLAEPDPELGLLPVVCAPRSAEGEWALSLAAGFGGQNSALVLERGTP